VLIALSTSEWVIFGIAIAMILVLANGWHRRER
jgi:hypothetical protein